MSRDITFRGKRLDGDGWVYGSLVGYVTSRGSEPSIYKHDTWETISIIPGTEGEYTGLHDSNGKGIYEGDILEDGGLIEYRTNLRFDGGGSIHSGFFSTRGYEYGDTGDLRYHYQISELAVIGNIYENPELLK